MKENEIEILNKINTSTAKALKLTPKEYEQYSFVKETVDAVEQAYPELKDKLLELDFETLYYSSKLLQRHTSFTGIRVEYIKQYFDEKEQGFTNKPMELFLIIKGCGLQFKNPKWDYPLRSNEYSRAQSSYLANSNQTSKSIFESRIPSKDRHIFIKALMDKFPYGLPSETTMLHVCKYYPALLTKTPVTPITSPAGNSNSTVWEQMVWAEFTACSPEDAKNMFGEDLNTFYEIRRIIVEHKKPSPEIEPFYNLLKKHSKPAVRRYLITLHNYIELYKAFEENYLTMFMMQREKEYLENFIEKLPQAFELTPEMINMHFVEFAYPGTDVDYVKVCGCNKIEFAIKFPAKYWLTQAILIAAFNIPNKTYMTKETLKAGEQMYRFFIDGLPIDTHVRRSFTELGISALHNIVSLSGSKPKSDVWIKSTLQQKQNQEPDLDSPFAW